jgi:hypothetical protein
MKSLYEIIIWNKSIRKPNWLNTTQWSKEKVQRDKHRSTKHIHENKDRVAWTPLNTGGELRQSGRVSSSYSTSGTRRVILVSIIWPLTLNRWLTEHVVSSIMWCPLLFSPKTMSFALHSCLYNYEFWLSLCKIVRSSVILLLPLFVLLYFFFWPLCCLFIFNLRILITPLISSNSSYPLVLVNLYTLFYYLSASIVYVL